MNHGNGNGNGVSRRTFLRGLGATVALPLLESVAPVRLLAGERAADHAGPACRMAFLYIPNGAHMQAWTPKVEGAGFDLPPTLEPLAPFRDELLVLTGLTQNHARPNGDGAGDHARSAASFLTGVQARKTSGADIRVGISVDQVAALEVGHLTRLPSLELGCEGGQQSGNCDSGYSCAYSSNISWRSESTPMAKETNPRSVFERLFGPGGAEGVEARERRRAERRSVLDFVLEDARSLRGKLGPTDRRKLDEYLASVREVERRIERFEKEAAAAPPEEARPPGMPKGYGEHIRVMGDLIALAFQADVTRVTTFMIANEGTNRNYKEIGVPEGHHDLSHHGGDAAKQAKIAQINRFQVEGLAYLLGKLKSIREGEGTLLDASMVVMGSGLSDGNRHNHDDLPLLLAGRGAGTLSPGRHVRYAKDTPLNDLYLSLLDRMEVRREHLGDSKGRLPMLYGAARSY